MKFSKLDPMTMLMLVVAFGVLVTMLTQNSVASEDGASLATNILEKETASSVMVTASDEAKVVRDGRERGTLHSSSFASSSVR